jgi:hypothetical protein
VNANHHESKMQLGLLQQLVAFWLLPAVISFASSEQFFNQFLGAELVGVACGQDLFAEHVGAAVINT